MLDSFQRNFNRQVYAEVLLQEEVNLSHREPLYGVLHVNAYFFVQSPRCSAVVRFFFHLGKSSTVASSHGLQETTSIVILLLDRKKEHKSCILFFGTA